MRTSTDGVAQDSQRRTLYLGGRLYTPTDPFATAMLVADGVVAWLGSDGAAEVMRDIGTTVVDLDGALVTPAFVDAHLHTTATGMVKLGLDLTDTGNLAEVLDAVRSRVGAGVIIGYGWDERSWPEARPPTSAELDRAGYGGAVFLDRADVHSSVASSSLLAALPELREMDGYDSRGWLRHEAHDYARAAVYAELPAELRAQAQRWTRAEAARYGIGAIHEIGGPSISSHPDVSALMSLAAAEPGPEVIAYWGELSAGSRALELGCAGAAGDLYIDGTVGSHTAALREPYADNPTAGYTYVTAAQVRDHVVHCAEANIQAGFHVIGDAALDTVLAGFVEAGEAIGADRVRAGGHRLEHVELVRPEHISVMADFGIIASVQPRFDEEWGGPDGMYAERLGDRWQSMNPFAAMQAGGVVLAFGSDSPVTSLDPWQAVRAAAQHRTPGQALSVRAAFSAHTRGGWRAAGLAGGVLEPGAPASLAVWRADELVVAAPDGRVSAWSTDPRSATPGLPVLTDGAPSPVCLRTVVRGTTVYDVGALAGD